MGLLKRFLNTIQEPENGRIPVSKIPKDWDSGFKEGYPLWEKGEKARKSGDCQKAIDFYDEARNKGYLAPALYNSYAMTYRKMKDRESEIEILEEGISRLKAAKLNYEKLSEQLKKAKNG